MLVGSVFGTHDPIEGEPRKLQVAAWAGLTANGNKLDAKNVTINKNLRSREIIVLV